MKDVFPASALRKALICSLILVPVSIAATGCDRYELISRTQTQDSSRDATLALEQRVNELQSQVETLRTQLKDRPSEKENENGRYQLVVNPQNSRSSYLLDTRLGVAWGLVQDWKQKRDIFIPLGFRGGYSVPAIQSETGELLNAEKETESLRSLAEVHQYVKQVQARNASEAGMQDAAAEPEGVPAETAQTTEVPPVSARAALGHSEGNAPAASQSSSHHSGRSRNSRSSGR